MREAKIAQGLVLSLGDTVGGRREEKGKRMEARKERRKELLNASKLLPCWLPVT